MDKNKEEQRMEDVRTIESAVVAAYGAAPDLLIDKNLMARLVGDAQSDNVVAMVHGKQITSKKWFAFPAAAWGSIAASLVVGALLGYGLQPKVPEAMIASKDGRLLAQGILAEQLTSQIASEQSNGGVDIGLSFKSANRVCRTFASEAQYSGVSCRAGKLWQVEMVMAQTEKHAANEYRLASSETPPAVMAFVDGIIVGDVLDPAAEVSARKSGWVLE